MSSSLPAEHDQLLDLIEAGHADQAADLMQRHLEHTRGLWAGRERTSGSMSEAEVGLDPRLPLRYLSPADVAARIELASVVDAVRDAFVAAAGDADDQPQRLSLGGGGSW